MSCQYCGNKQEQFMNKRMKNVCSSCYIFIDALGTKCSCQKNLYNCETCLLKYNSLYDDGILKNQPIMVGKFLRNKNNNNNIASNNIVLGTVVPQKITDFNMMNDIVLGIPL